SLLQPEYPFEWAGTFELGEGAYELALQPGPDPTLKVVSQYLDAQEDAGERGPSERAMRVWSLPEASVRPRDTVEVGATQPAVLDLTEGAPLLFTLRSPRPGRVGVFTQHLPREFELELRQAGAAIHALAETEFAAGHTHDAEVSSVGIHLEGELDGQRLDAWMSELLREHGADIFRMKGILNVRDSANRLVFQGVHMLFDSNEDRAWGVDEKRASDLVFIGRRLDRTALTRGFERCLA
ncbi:MAG: hypothetical protein RLZZ450_5772, partial [Pseudomonadota bacterium]